MSWWTRRHAGRGIGEALSVAALEEARRRGAKDLNLTSRPSREGRQPPVPAIGLPAPQHELLPLRLLTSLLLVERPVDAGEAAADRLPALLVRQHVQAVLRRWRRRSARRLRRPRARARRGRRSPASWSGTTATLGGRRSRPGGCARSCRCSCRPRIGHSTDTPISALAQLAVQHLGQRDDAVLGDAVRPESAFGTSPANDAVNRMWPPSPCSTMRGRNASTPWIGPHRSTSIVQRQSSWVISASARRPRCRRC